jgi:P-type Cu+ transporter
MACCYIAASMIAFIINTCEALDINLHLQYNESVSHDTFDDDNVVPSYEPSDGDPMPHEKDADDAAGVSVYSIMGMTCAACTSTVGPPSRRFRGCNRSSCRWRCKKRACSTTLIMAAKPTCASR